MDEFIENESVDEMGCEEGYDEEVDPRDYEDGLSDVEADAMTLASCGFGTDEDYGDYGQEGEW